MDSTRHLRQLLAEQTTHFVPTCYDALSARMVRSAGYPLVFLSGYGVSATRIGLPDIGFLTQTEIVSQVRELTANLPGFPVIADADTGHGNALNVFRTVTELIRAGAAGLQLEDQVFPKRCGHIGAKAVVSRAEARAKVRAAVDAREQSGRDIVIMARTDARKLTDFDEAMERCLDFQAEGADIIFMEALQDVDEMKRFVRALKVPAWGNNSRGRESFMLYLDRAVVRDIGFRIVTDPTLLFSVTATIAQHLRAHLADDENAYPSQVTFSEMNAIMGVPHFLDAEKRYSA